MALGEIIARLSVELGLNSAAFEQGAKKAGSSSKKLGSDMEALGFKVGKSLKALSIAGLAVGIAVGEMGRRVAASGKQIENSARLANTSVEQFQRVAGAARSVGIENEKLADILKDTNDKFGEFLTTGGGELKDFFDVIAPKVGVTAEMFRNLSGPDALQLYVTSLEKAGVNQQQMTFYMEALADEATALIPLLRNNGAELKRLGDQTKIYTQADIEGLKRLDQSYQNLGSAITGLGVSLAKSGILDGLSNIITGAAGMASQLEPVINKLREYSGLVGLLGGAAIGARYGGVPGAVIGGIAGLATGSSLGSSMNDADMSLGFRRQKQQEALDRYNQAKRVAGSPAYYATQEKELRRQTALLKQSTELSRGGSASTLPALGTGAGISAPAKTSGAKGGGRSGLTAADIEARFNNELANYAQQVLSARQSLATTAEEAAELDLRSVELARIRTIAGIKAEEDYSEAQKQRLLLEVEDLANAERERIARDLQRQQEDEANEVSRQQLDAQRERLQSQLSLADTDADRQRIAMELFDLDQQDKRQTLERIAHSSARTAAERALAQAALNQLDANASLQRASAMRSSETRTQAYLRSLKQTPEQINEAMDDIKVDGLDALNQGLADVVTGAKNVGAVFKGIADQIISDLARIAIRKAIIEPLANALFGGSSLFGGSASSSGGAKNVLNFKGARAKGGPVSAGGAYLVGERGPELVSFNQGGHVFSNADSRGMMGVGRSVVEIVDTTGLFVTRVNGQIMTAAPAIVGASSKVSMATMAHRQTRRVG